MVWKPTGSRSHDSVQHRSMTDSLSSLEAIPMVRVLPRYLPQAPLFKLNFMLTMSCAVGPRACIGRKFAAIEAVCFLTLLRDWRVEPAPSSMKPGETGEEWKERMMDAKMFLTLGPGSVPVRLVRREK